MPWEFDDLTMLEVAWYSQRLSKTMENQRWSNWEVPKLINIALMNPKSYPTWNEYNKTSEEPEKQDFKESLKEHGVDLPVYIKDKKSS